jgi:hypothetical protein
MPRITHPIPRPSLTVIQKTGILRQLIQIDSSEAHRARVLALETSFRRKITAHAASLLLANEPLRKFNTSPFVLLIHAFSRRYNHVSQIERDILPAKQFSSMETSAGRMVEEVVLPAYGWECVASNMHSSNSALDGRFNGSNPYKIATLKSGPRCLNDEMSENFADAIIEYATSWAREGNVEELDFTYGVLYGTPAQSNKKDWHILRKLCEKASSRTGCQVLVSPRDAWSCKVKVGGVKVNATIRIGSEWWRHLGGDTCLMEVLAALVRACIVPSNADEAATYTIRDMSSIVDMANVAEDYNVSILQRSQLPWLFLTAAHFCDTIG